MVVYATHEHGYNKVYEPIMTWHRAEAEPTGAVVNFTHDLSDERILHLGNGNKEFFAESCGYGTKDCIFAFVKADDMENCFDILKEQYPLLRTDGSGARYLGIHIRELGVPESLAKTYDKEIYKCR